MGTHVHMALLAGEAPPWRFLKPLHLSVARFLNRADRTFGPVFAERATTVVMAPGRMAPLVAYIHNNPVRAGVVSHPTESSWTSHRAWLGLEAAPAWLAVQQGLACAGFEDSQAGRDAFDDYVIQRKGAPRDATWSGARPVPSQW